MPKITIDGRTAEISQGATILEAAQSLGIFIPRYCYHPALSISGTCRMCLVEVEKTPKLQIACDARVADGMVVHTDTPAVKKARQDMLEYLLINHPLDCPICDQAGECLLQDYYMDYGLYKSHFPRRDKIRRPKRVRAGRYLVLDNERCILCTRCVRFCDEVTKTGELGVFERNDASIISLKGGTGVDNDYSLNIADICPVGAFTSSDFRFKQRVWFLRKMNGICTGCAAGCNIEIHYNLDKIYRLMPAPNPETNIWLCDPGRMTYKVNQAPERLRSARLGKETADIAPALRRAACLIDEAVEAGGENAVAILGSPYLSLEDNAALAELARTSVGTANLCLDFTWEQGVKDGILINKDPTPNANGLRMLREIYGGLDRSALEQALGSGKIRLVIAEQRMLSALGPFARKPGARSLVLGLVENQPGLEPDCLLPHATSFEAFGHFVNYKGLVQSTPAVVPPPPGIEPAWKTLDRVASYTGNPIRLDDEKSVHEKIRKFIT